MAKIPVLSYPLYALRIGQGFVCFPRSAPGEKTKINAVIVCTHRAIARTCIADMKLDAQLVPICNSENFRHFLKANSASAAAVAFDPDIDVENHHIEMRGFGRIAEILEALPDPIFVWSYPLYVLRTAADKYAAFSGTSGRGDSRFGVAVFTDEDLAQRYNEVRRTNDKILPVDDALAFSLFLRKQRAPFVSFDPSKVAKGMASRCTIPVPNLLKQLPKPK